MAWAAKAEIYFGHRRRKIIRLAEWLLPSVICTLQLSVINIVLKDKHGDITSTDMYRPITVTPVMSKLFELVLLQLYGDFLTSDNLQLGFKKETGCSHALFTLTESVKTFG